MLLPDERSPEQLFLALETLLMDPAQAGYLPAPLGTPTSTSLLVYGPARFPLLVLLYGTGCAYGPNHCGTTSRLVLRLCYAATRNGRKLQGAQPTVLAFSYRKVTSPPSHRPDGYAATLCAVLRWR